MTSKRKINPELMRKAEKIRKEMLERGESYHDIVEDLEEGSILGPRDDIEYQKLKKTIRDLDNE